jgi:hypothetical protein
MHESMTMSCALQALGIATESPVDMIACGRHFMYLSALTQTVLVPGGIGNARLSLLLSSSAGIGVWDGVGSLSKPCSALTNMYEVLEDDGGTECTGLDRMVRMRTSLSATADASVTSESKVEDALARWLCR